jgi:hypothetical protein
MKSRNLSYEIVKQLLFAGLMLHGPVAWAAEVPRPPCGTSSVYPSFAGPGAAPHVQVWHLTPDWTLPDCVGWTADNVVVVAVAAQFRFAGSTEDLLTRFGAISKLQGIRYWSVLDHDWRTLITHATALDGPDLTKRRHDFTVDEMKGGDDVYFMQDDNRTHGDVIYRLRVLEFAPARFVIKTENFSAVTNLFVTVAKPGDLRTMNFLQRQSPGVWSYYGIAETSEPLLPIPDDSYANRATAYYRHLIGDTALSRP